MSVRALLGAAAIAAAGTVALTVQPAAANPPGHETCGRQFDNAVAAYLDTTARHDARGFEALLDDDYTVVLPGGTVFAGKAAGSEFIDHFFARTDWTQTFTRTRRVLQGCRSGLVLFDSTYTDGDGSVPLVIGLTWTRHHGGWLVVQDQNTVKG